jgi:hypothetical protein
MFKIDSQLILNYLEISFLFLLKYIVIEKITYFFNEIIFS